MAGVHVFDARQWSTCCERISRRNSNSAPTGSSSRTWWRAGRSIGSRFRLPGRSFVTRWVINGLGFSGVRSPLRRVVCVVFAGSKREREARGPPHSSLPLVASSRHAGLSEWTFFRLGHVAVSLSISTSWSRSLPNKKPMSQSQVLSAQARSAHSALDAHRALTRKLTRKHTHTQKAYAESICRKSARAHTHRHPPEFLLIVSAPDVPFE